MQHFTISQPGPGVIAQAYPLVRMTAPEVTLEQWREHAGRLFATGGGILAVSAGDSSLLGLATYRPEEDLRHGRVLRIDTIVTFELSHTSPARQALCEGLDRLARELGCSAVTLTLDCRGYVEPACPKCESWLKLGLEPETVTLAKTLRKRRAAEVA